MQDEALKNALSEMEQAFRMVNQVFDNHLRFLKENNGDPSAIRQTDEAVRALRDGSAMVMAWAYHYAGLSQDEETQPLP